MTLLIADDEELIRFTIKDMLREIPLEFTSIREAASGTELIKLCREEPPSIALVDIRMPGMNGLEAIEELNRDPGETVWIILTGYSEFDYARKALRLDVCEYLLKPPSPDELSRVLIRAEEILFQKKQRDNREFEGVLNSFFNNTDSPESFDHMDENDLWLGFMICLDSTLSQKEDHDYFTSLSRKIRHDYLSALPHGRGGLIVLENGSLLILIRMKKDKPELTIIPDPEPFLAVPPPGLVLTLWKTGQIRGFKELKSQVAEWILDTPSRFIGSRPESLSEEEEQLCLELEQLLLNPVNTALQRAGLDRIFSIIPLLARDKQAYLRCFLTNIFSFQEKELPWDSLREKLLNRESADSSSAQSLLVKRALRIAEDEFDQDMGIAQVAYRLQVTPNYLSAVFHKALGVKFTRYLTSLRIEKAKKLLSSSHLTIKEIAAETGYGSGRYFADIFKKETGLSPSEFMNRKGL